jgi:hypothetical protein
MSRTFTRTSKTSTVTVRETPASRRPTVGPGGGGSAPPELVESDRRADVDELSDGGANSARHTGDQADRPTDEAESKKER